MVTQQSKDSK